MQQTAQSQLHQDGGHTVNLQDPASGKNLHEDHPKLKKIKTRTTIIEQREDEDLVYERIKDSRFKQQRLPAWRPVPTIMTIVIVFSIFGLVFIILGIILLAYSKKVKRLELEYSNKCTLGKMCTQSINVEEDIDKPVFIYYQLDGFYQNSRRYLKSKNTDQLRGKTKDTDDCEPAETYEQMNLGINYSINGNPLNMKDNAIPCGLVAKTFFNDTYNFSINNESIFVDETDISFAKDRDLYSENNYPDQQWHDLTDEHFLVWMRPSGLPNPRKLWGKIDRDLKVGETININIANNYNVTAYKGKKKIILSNATVFGGKNKFLGISYIVVGCLGILCAIIFPIGYRFQLAKEKDL